MIVLTEKAQEKLQSVFSEKNLQDRGLRVTAKRISPMAPVEYGLEYVETGQEHPDDAVHEFDGLKVYVDPQSAPLLEDATVDYVMGLNLNESGFKITGSKAESSSAPTGPAAERIQHLLETEINPAIAGHGGNVTLVDIKDDVVYLQLGGGCQGCGMVDVTLKQGIEVRIKETVPEIKEVYDVTDHAGGKNPYYQPGK